MLIDRGSRGCRRVGVVSWLFTREVRRELSLTLAERLAFQGCKRPLASVFGPNGLLKGDVGGQVLVINSTLGLQTV